MHVVARLTRIIFKARAAALLQPVQVDRRNSYRIPDKIRQTTRAFVARSFDVRYAEIDSQGRYPTSMPDGMFVCVSNNSDV